MKESNRTAIFPTLYAKTVLIVKENDEPKKTDFTTRRKSS